MKYSVAILIALLATAYSGDHWFIYDIAKLSLISVVSYVLWMEVSYKKMMLKSVALIVFLDSIWSFGQFFTDGSLSLWLALINALIFPPWFAWALRRSYEVNSVPIEDGKTYWVSHRPNNITGFITSLFGGPVGGYSFYMNGTLYGYHRGSFGGRRLSASKLHVVAIESNVKESQELTEYLSKLNGKKWSLLHNCVTLRLKIWRSYV